MTMNLLLLFMLYFVTVESFSTEHQNTSILNFNNNTDLVGNFSMSDIVGVFYGTEVKSGWRFVGYLLFNGERKRECTVVVTHEQKLLVAAHCRITEEWSKYVIYLGNYGKGQGTIHDVEKIVVMDEYDGDPYHGNDLAVIYLTLPIDFGFLPDFPIEIVEIADTDEMPDSGTIVEAAGFGLYQPISQPSSKLRFGQFRVMTFNECKAKAQEALRPHICAINSKQLMGSGDSGGPLMHNNKLVGILSIGYERYFENEPNFWVSLGTRRVRKFLVKHGLIKI